MCNNTFIIFLVLALTLPVWGREKTRQEQMAALFSLIEHATRW
jgi:hypothetical protein